MNLHVGGQHHRNNQINILKKGWSAWPEQVVNIAGAGGQDGSDYTIIDKNRDNFSLDLFKTEYAYYGRDLLDMMEPGFLEYLYTFLHDEGLPYLAETVNLGSLTCKLYDLVLDFKRCLNPKLYQKLWDNSFYYSPPYLVLCAFNEKPQQTLLKAFTVMDWDEPGVKENFIDFLKKNYPDSNIDVTLKTIEKYTL